MTGIRNCALHVIAKACRLGTSFQTLSDMRRTLIRGLQYLTLGVDVDGQQQRDARPIIFDAGLKKAADTMAIPLSARLIYNLLIMVLMEHEGVLDDLMIRKRQPGINFSTSFFQTKMNIEIVQLVVAQDSWLAKLCVAFTLFGREDAADRFLAKQLRLLRGLAPS
jgi:hypothetical protein